LFVLGAYFFAGVGSLFLFVVIVSDWCMFSVLFFLVSFLFFSLLQIEELVFVFCVCFSFLCASDWCMLSVLFFGSFFLISVLLWLQIEELVCGASKGVSLAQLCSAARASESDVVAVLQNMMERQEKKKKNKKETLKQDSVCVIFDVCSCLQWSLLQQQRFVLPIVKRDKKKLFLVFLFFQIFFEFFSNLPSVRGVY
jgi:hypothetical protein